MLSFEYIPDDEVLELHGDVEGLEKLRGDIDNIIKVTKDGGFEHTHLLIPEWGGGETLSGDKMNTDDSVKLIPHVKIVCWKK
ncbi:MAG: Imm32 family immunity protein [Phycisphaerae bacterium]|jgi:hypothetical protein|nr:Imm32 family immunity protein [Phycisphaerae bacterium]